ncbi:MAG TPA: hypothetical protein VJN18_19230 [Polyangiaceae bacterium]|nr:hypothetical protein [Polyangiaceae bacterium]
MKRKATLRVWTPDYGKVVLKLDRDDERTLYFLQETLDLGLWAQLRRFPPDVVARLLPRLTLSPHRRKLLEIWIEEKTAAATA